MKTRKIIISLIATVFVICLGFTGYVYAATVTADDNTICNGVTIGQFDVSGLTKDEALNKINDYVNSLANSNINFTVQGDTVTYKVSDFELTWSNPETVDEAYDLCKKGNVLERYKSTKDIESKGQKYDLNLTVNEELLKETLDKAFAAYEKNMVNASIKKVSGQFVVTDSEEGLGIDIDTTTSNLLSQLLDPSWSGNDFNVDVITEVIKPKYTKDAFASFSSTPLGTKTTTYTAGAKNRNANIRRATELINGTVVYPGEEFNTNSILNPFTYENGYYDAGSYEGGRVVDSIGGGVCQVSSTLFNAVLYSELEVTERWAHSMSVSYLPLSADAALAGDYKNFRFVNSTDYPIYVEGTTTSTSVTFSIYGVETRDPNRSIAFESETLAIYEPDQDVVTEDPTLPAGTRQVVSQAHTGSKAQLWKIVYYNGVEQSRSVIYTSTYKSTPNYITVGTMQTEPETTDTPEIETDENGNPIPVETDENGNPVPTPSEGETAETPSDTPPDNDIPVEPPAESVAQ